MSRVIKFRAWTGKRMVTLDPAKHEGTLSDLIESDTWKVMQFTGLTDHDDVEVYEGDILSFSFGIPPLCVNGELAFRNGGFVVLTPTCISKECPLGDLKWHVGGFYVVGNIHENPELLEEKP